MDYLPRKEEEQVALEKLVSIATRGAQLAYYIDDGVFENPEDPTEEKKAYVEEIWEAIEFLEVNCGAKISGQLVIEEKWSELASEFGKWANYIAMLYGKEESDYLVNFIDYVRWPRKKFPKEWFAETYSATFENFMFPIPCEYDQLLRNIYRNYKVRVKSTDQHDYPYYVKQLRQLGKVYREQVNWPELPELSVVLDEVMTGEEDVSLPSAWKSIVIKEGERRKKIVLFTNDISVFLTYPEKRL